jgi:hypothetical protein
MAGKYIGERQTFAGEKGQNPAFCSLEPLDKWGNKV